MRLHEKVALYGSVWVPVSKKGWARLLREMREKDQRQWWKRITG